MRQYPDRVRELAQRDEQAAAEGEQHQREAQVLHDVLGRQQVAKEQAERREDQRADPDADRRDDPQIAVAWLHHGHPAERGHDVDRGHRGRAEHHRGQHLDHDVSGRRQRGQPELPAPALRPFDRHHGATAGRREHRAVERHADHDERGDIAVAGGKIRIRLVQPEQQEEQRRDDEREDHGPTIAQQPANLEQEHGRVDAPRRALDAYGGRWRRLRAHRAAPLATSSALPLSLLVRAMKASSRPRVLISRSLASVSVSKYLATLSLSLEWISTVSPRTSTLSAPGMASSAASSGSGMVARTVRPDASAFTSAPVPSATISPWRSNTTRSAYASASSR